MLQLCLFQADELWSIPPSSYMELLQNPSIFFLLFWLALFLASLLDLMGICLLEFLLRYSDQKFSVECEDKAYRFIALKNVSFSVFWLLWVFLPLIISDVLILVFLTGVASWCFQRTSHN